ncbi:MAG TPA: aldo/keto reductase [Tepidisphaeraceae bacterium]|nr:aldo/keto reductase [Tepidisphaeraceae bacterium]
MRRREFLKAAAATTAAAALESVAGPLAAQQPSDVSLPGATGSNPPRLPRRAYKPGIDLSIIGFGGIVVMNAEPDHAARVVAQAVEKGVNYFDVAPSYGDAEVKLGPALRPYRKDVFLACKTAQRTRQAAEEEMKRSLQRLHTDYFDLYQLHAITDVKKDVDAAFASGGVMELLIQARKEGRIRHIGFSAHSVEATLAALDRFEFDSVLIPINFATFYKGNFGPQMIAAAEKAGAARLALKALARQKWPQNDPLRARYPKAWYQPLTDRHEAELALRFTLSQPVTAAIPPGEEELFWLAVELAMNHRPITESETRELMTLSQSLEPIFRATA